MIKSIQTIEVTGNRIRALATAVEEYARECALLRMHGERPEQADFTRVAWVEFPFDQPFANKQEAIDALSAKVRRPDLALMASYGRNKWVAATVKG